MSLELGVGWDLAASTRWAARVSTPLKSATQFAPQKTLKAIAWKKLTFDERFVVHRPAMATGSVLGFSREPQELVMRDFQGRS